MFKPVLIALMLTTVLSRMEEVFARALNNNDEYLPGQDMEQENPTQTRNKRCLDDLLDAVIDLLFEDDDEDDDNSKENDGGQDICSNCAVIVNNVNHFNLPPTTPPVGKPKPQPPALNEDKAKTLTGPPNSEVTPNPNTQTTKPATEETKTTAAATKQVADEPTTTSIPKVVDATANKPNADAEVAIPPAESKPEAVEGAKM